MPDTQTRTQTHTHTNIQTYAEAQTEIPASTHAILQIIQKRANFILTTEANEQDLFSPVHASRIEAFVRNEEKIHFILPAFPAKSPNQEKTLGAEPDFGEVLALTSLQQLCDEIKAVHAPGAEILICSDGRVFSDLVGVPDSIVSRYSRGIERIIEQNEFMSLKTFHLENAFQAEDFDEMREELVTTHGQKVEQIREETKASLAARWLFNGIHRFVFEDKLGQAAHLSRERVRREAKEVTYKMIQRSNAWSRLVETIFAESVRLSIHPQVPQSAKIGIQLVPSENIWRTPWHSVALEDQGKFTLVRRRDAEAMGARRTQKKGFEFFTLNESERAHA